MSNLPINDNNLPDEESVSFKFKKNFYNKKILIISSLVLLIFFAGGFYVYLKHSFIPGNKPSSNTPDAKENLTNGFNFNVAIKSGYRQQIILPEIGNDEIITGRQIFINLDTKSLIDQRKLSFDCSNLYFTDENNEEIPFWTTQDECYKKDSIYWLNIPNTAPHEKKIIYVHYSNESAGSLADFGKVFSKQDNSLVVGYFLGPLMMYKDFSGNENDGKDIKGIGYDFWGTYYDDWGHYFFNHWGCGGEYDYSACGEADFNSVNFKASSSQDIDYSQGTIEMWIKPYVTVSDNYQKIFSDSGGNIELGLQPDGDLYFYPAQAATQNYNLVKNPLIADEWNHIVVTWDFNSKNSTFYINGKKQINNIENIPSLWKEKPKMGNKWNIGGFAFAGFIDGLRIYSKALSAKEIADAYKYNNQALRNPEFTFGKEELVFQEGNTANPFVDISIDEIPKTDKITVTNHYATLLNGYFESDAYYYDGHPAYLVSKEDNSEEGQPERSYGYDNFIFGYNSHFDPYAGTPLTAKDSFLLTHVGLKINNPDLVKRFKIELLTSSCGWEIGSRNGFLSSIIPDANACGGCGSSATGESYLNFIGEQSGISWYALENPLLVYNKTDLMQMYYWANDKEGLLSLELSGMLFQSKEGNFVKTQVEGFDYCGYFDYGTKECLDNNQESNPSAFYAYFAPSEHGRIAFSQRGKTNNLLISFTNQGGDIFTIDEDSIKSIRTIFSDYQRVDNINIRNEAGNIVYSMGIENIMEDIVGKTIKPNESLSVVLSPNLENSKSYWITLGVAPTEGRVYPLNKNLQKIIHWTIGSDSYYYPSKAWGDRVLYKLNISQDGVFEIKKTDSKEIP